MPSGRGKRVSLTEAQRNLFVAGTQFVNSANGRVNTAFTGMTLRGNAAARDANGNKIMGKNGKPVIKKGFKDVRNVSLPNWYKGTGIHTIKNSRGQVIDRRTKNPWQASIFKAGRIIQLKDLKEMALQLTLASHLSMINMEHWKYVLALRAQKIFQESFELKRFNSDGTSRWKANTRTTYLKRVRKGTWPGAGRLMQETGALSKSIIVKPNGKGNQVVTTGPAADGRIYAAVHNNPTSGMTYGKIYGAKPVTQRQFMGHSTKIDEFITKYEQRYLFDSVFRVPKGIK